MATRYAQKIGYKSFLNSCQKRGLLAWSTIVRGSKIAFLNSLGLLDTAGVPSVLQETIEDASKLR